VRANPVNTPAISRQKHNYAGDNAANEAPNVSVSAPRHTCDVNTTTARIFRIQLLHRPVTTA
jgi:hypothetical protein